MIEPKYISLLSHRLRNFKRKGNVFNFSCPICGDSETKKNRARAYVYEKKGIWMFHCHKCTKNLKAATLIKLMDAGLYSEYLIELLQDKPNPTHEFVNKMKPQKYTYSEVLKNLQKVSQLSPNHPAKKFVVSRKIPTPYHAKLYACPNYMHFTNKIIANKFDEKALKHDEMRLLIPFISASGEVHAYQGRSLRPNADVRYITIIIDETYPKVYGLDTVNFNLPVPVFEGPIDSMFINNSIAIAGGEVNSLGKINTENLIIVYDNEPRSKETVKKIDKAINQGYKVCIWPSNIEQKDINDMILKGFYTSTTISDIIRDNTFSGLSAKLALTKWSKV